MKKEGKKGKGRVMASPPPLGPSFSIAFLVTVITAVSGRNLAQSLKVKTVTVGRDGSKRGSESKQQRALRQGKGTPTSTVKCLRILAKTHGACVSPRLFRIQSNGH